MASQECFRTAYSRLLLRACGVRGWDIQHTPPLDTILLLSRHKYLYNIWQYHYIPSQITKRKKNKPKCKFIYIYRYTIFIRGGKIISLPKQSKQKWLVHAITANWNMYVYLFDQRTIRPKKTRLYSHNFYMKAKIIPHSWKDLEKKCTEKKNSAKMQIHLHI